MKNVLGRAQTTPRGGLQFGQHHLHVLYSRRPEEVWLAIDGPGLQCDQSGWEMRTFPCFGDGCRRRGRFGGRRIEALYLRSMRFHFDEQSALSKGLFLNQYSFHQGSPVLCCPHCIGSPTGQMPRAGQANACSAGVSLVSGSLDLREFSSDTQACLLYMRSSQYIQEQSTFFFSCMY